MNSPEAVDLATLVAVVVDLSLEGRTVLLRTPAPPAEELLAFYMFRRAWPVGSVLCHFDAPEGAN